MWKNMIYKWWVVHIYVSCKEGDGVDWDLPKPSDED
jgi:hypothetical protein